MKRKIYSELASLVCARLYCLAKEDNANAQVWADRHEDKIGRIVDEAMPSGSGWDNGTEIDLDASSADRLVFYGAFHHMDEHGGYDGWTEHRIIVTPNLMSGFSVKVTGRNRNDIKSYLGEMFYDALEQFIDYTRDENGAFILVDDKPQFTISMA